MWTAGLRAGDVYGLLRAVLSRRADNLHGRITVALAWKVKCQTVPDPVTPATPGGREAEMTTLPTPRRDNQSNRLAIVAR